MAAEVGYTFLFLILFASLISVICIIRTYDSSGARQLALVCCGLAFLGAAGAFFSLMYCYLTSDFSVLNVFSNSHSAKPVIYKIAGVWGNHEGSMLLMLLNITALNFAFLVLSRRSKEVYQIISIQSAIVFFICLFTLCTSNPFIRIFPSPIDGLGLNPILQDIGLLFHPPILYFGYIGSSICFSSAVVCLVNGRMEQAIISIIRPWIMLSWSMLTLGITLGAWWAYRELGWGGYWFWDPVENASLMPWLMITIFFHSLSPSLKIYRMSIFFGILSFAAAILGTFLVRSGSITSVHSFAQDPKRGMFIGLFFLLFIGGAFILYLFRVRRISSSNGVRLYSVPGFLLINNVLLLFAFVVVIFGTVYPMLYEYFVGGFISVGAPYFNSMLRPAVFFVCIFSTVALLYHTGLKAKMVILYLACVVTGLLWYFLEIHDWHLLFIFASLYLMIGMMREVILRFKTLSRIKYAILLAHFAFGLAIFSITLNAKLECEKAYLVAPGEEIQFNGYKLTLLEVYHVKGPNYISRSAYFVLGDDVKRGRAIIPETRLFQNEKMQTTEMGITHSLFYDICIVIGTYDGDRISANIMFKPMMSFLWLAGALLFFSGVIFWYTPIYSFITQRSEK